MRPAPTQAASAPPGRELASEPRTQQPAVSRRIAPPDAPANTVIEPDAPRHLAAIVRYSNDAIYSRTLDGVITTWNEASARMFGYRAEEILGRSSRLLLPRGHRDEFCRLLARTRRGEVVQHFETDRLRKDGRRICVSLTLSPIRDSAGRLTGFSTIARDITEQRRVYEALARRERELEDLFEEASVGLLLTTRDGRILSANPALRAIFGCTVDECLGRSLADFHPDGAKLADLLDQLSRRETLRNLQTALRSRGGRIKEVLVDASALWERGKVVHIRWFIRDITRRKQLERQVLAISERERRAFARELHDSLGQQLTGIAYLSNVARDRLREQGSPEAPEVARISRLLKQAIEETRRVSRGLSPVRPEPDGLRAALGELAAHTRSVFAIDCRLRCPKPVPIPDSEAATHLYRIAQEAVNNALRHGRARRIGIRLDVRRGMLTLCIADNGQGIRPLSPRRKGLGMRVMQYRAGLLQGTLSVSRRPEGGTEVRCITSLANLKPSGSPG